MYIHSLNAECKSFFLKICFYRQRNINTQNKTAVNFINNSVIILLRDETANDVNQYAIFSSLAGDIRKNVKI